MPQRRFPSSRGFTLWELVIILVIIGVTIAILFPVFVVHRYPSRLLSCLSNTKQIGLALVQYVQDNDERFPPAIGQVRLSDGKTYEQQWGLTTYTTVGDKQEQIPGIISPYLKKQSFLQCPSVQTSNTGLAYLYSDLAAGESMENFTAPANAVAFADSEDRLRNVGHARSQSGTGDEAFLRPSEAGKTPRLLLGAAIGDAATRHSGGANYGFADGHAKWMKPEDVFFPPQTSISQSHREAKTGKLLGPDPSDAVQSSRTYQGRTYRATFHLR